MKKPPHMNRKALAAKTVRACLLGASCLLSPSAFGSPASAGFKVSTPPAQARAMTGTELYMLYRNKSWQWPDGAGRLQADGRRFTAWAGAADKASWAEGRWTVSDHGRLCLKARWHTVSGTYPNTTCFGHKQLGDTVYQKREPSGDWFVFKHAAPADDEFSKLVDQDLVSNDLERIKSSFDPLSKSIPDRRTKP